MDNLTTTGIAGGSGLLGIILAFFGCKSEIKNLKGGLKKSDENITELRKAVRYDKTCDEIHKAVDKRLESIEGMNKEMRDDIKELLKK